MATKYSRKNHRKSHKGHKGHKAHKAHKAHFGRKMKEMKEKMVRYVARSNYMPSTSKLMAKRFLATKGKHTKINNVQRDILQQIIKKHGSPTKKKSLYKRLLNKTLGNYNYKYSY